MGRKKKNEEIKFVPSKYQEAIFDFISNKRGNLLVEAVAGSGKTTTIIEALRLIPEDKKVLFCAFNKDIVKVLAKKTKEFPNTEVKTLHGLGYKVCTQNFKDISRAPNLNKYWEAFNSDVSKFTNHPKSEMNIKNWSAYQKNVMHILDLARLNLAKNLLEIRVLSERYGIPIIRDEYIVAEKLMEWGANNTDTMDYTDMVWYPNILDLDLSTVSYDYIFVDEAQDLSKAQREFILKCGKEHTRYVFVGDSNQSIYGFSAADPESFNELRKLPNITNLPLSVCYRCPKSVISYVHDMVSNIEAEADAIDGEIIENATFSNIEDQDMVLCRFNAPLFNAYSRLVNEGKKAFIMGKDIGKNLIDVVKSTKQSSLGVDLETKGVFSELLKYCVERCERHAWVEELCDNDQVLQTMKDNISALMVLTKNSQITTSAQLIDKISKIFNDNIKEGIVLSTIHKSKGLEANNVFILDCKEDKRHLQQWEKEQEKNLVYVACTRAKRKLAIIDATDLWLDNNMVIDNNYIADIEPKITELYSKNKVNQVRIGSIFHDIGKRLGETPKMADSTSLNGLIGKKKKKTIRF